MTIGEQTGELSDAAAMASVVALADRAASYSTRCLGEWTTWNHVAAYGVRPGRDRSGPSARGL